MLIEKNLTIRSETLSIIERPSSSPVAPLVLFFHGYPDTNKVWQKQLEGLEGDYHLIAPSLPGLNDVKKFSPHRFKREHVAMDLMELVGQYDPQSQRDLYLICHDLGGCHAHHLASLWPHRVKGLIFVNSVGLEQFTKRLKNFRQLRKSYYIFLFQIPFIAETLFSLRPKYSLKKIYQIGGLASHDHLEDDKHFHSLRGIHQYRQFFKELPQLLTQKIKKLPMPALYIWGENDPFLEIPTQNEVDQFFDFAQIRVLPGSHWIHRDLSDRINTLIGRSLESWAK